MARKNQPRARPAPHVHLGNIMGHPSVGFEVYPIIDRIIKNLSVWLGEYLSCRGKLILLTTCIVNISMYLMSMMKFPKWAIDAITYQMPHFFCGSLRSEHKYHLAKWELISTRKEFGGMGVPNLRDFNLAMLAAWFQ